MSTMNELQRAFNAGYEKGKTAFHACTLIADDGELNVPGVTYRRWLIGQCLQSMAVYFEQQDISSEAAADSIVSLVDAIIKRERQS